MHARGCSCAMGLWHFPRLLLRSFSLLIKIFYCYTLAQGSCVGMGCLLAQSSPAQPRETCLGCQRGWGLKPAL